MTCPGSQRAVGGARPAPSRAPWLSSGLHLVTVLQGLGLARKVGRTGSFPKKGGQLERTLGSGPNPAPVFNLQGNAQGLAPLPQALSVPPTKDFSFNH